MGQHTQTGVEPEETPIQMARIENWYLVNDRLFGEIYGHPNHADGTRVHTSTLVSLDDKQAKTRNTLYELGVPRTGYKPAIDASLSVQAAL